MNLNLFELAKSFGIAGMILIIALFPELAAYAQSPDAVASPAQKTESVTPLIPSGKAKPHGALGKADRRRDLVRQTNQLIVQMNVQEGALREAKAAFDGTSRSALTYHSLAIEITGGLADTLPLLSVTVDDLRSEIRADLEQKRELTSRRAAEAEASQSVIEDLGSQIIGGKDAAGNPLGQEQLDDLKSVMHQRILQRNERQADVGRFESDVRTYEQELDNLKKLDRRLEGMSVVSQAYLERLLDAVENERLGMVTDDIVQSRQSLQDVLSALETRTQSATDPIPTTRHHQAERAGVATGDLSSRLKQTLKPAETAIVEQELQKLAQKRGEAKSL
jgi:hypothetical protein